MPAQAAARKTERRAGVEGLLPAAQSLKLGAGEGAAAGPTHGAEQLRNEFRPCDGTCFGGFAARSGVRATEIAETLLRLLDTRDPGGGQGGACILADKVKQRPARALELAAETSAHPCGQVSRFVRAGGKLPGGDEPVELGFLDRRVEPAQDEQRPTRERNLAE